MRFEVLFGPSQILLRTPILRGRRCDILCSTAIRDWPRLSMPYAGYLHIAPDTRARLTEVTMAIRQKDDLSDAGRAEAARPAWLRPPVVCFLLGLLGVLPLVVLTPPFQVPDENQHFLRAYQLSEFRFTAIMQEGEARSKFPSSLEARAMLPSSLIELIESFSGTRVVFNPGPTSEQPLHRTWLALERPLDPERRELVSLLYAAKAPPSYVPQAIAIAAGRWSGAGPLALLYLGRLANALVAVIVLAWAVQLMPIGRELTMFFGLLPMAIHEYASVSADATVITTAFLFTAAALRAQLRGHWKPGEVALAMASGLVFCTQKPVYAPLLLLGLPAAFGPGQPKHTVLVHTAIIVIVLGGAVAWMRFASRYISVPLGAAFRVRLPLSRRTPSPTSERWRARSGMEKFLIRTWLGCWAGRCTCQRSPIGCRWSRCRSAHWRNHERGRVCQPSL
jgi:hypothetical protein